MSPLSRNRPKPASQPIFTAVRHGLVPELREPTRVRLLAHPHTKSDGCADGSERKDQSIRSCEASLSADSRRYHLPGSRTPRVRGCATRTGTGGPFDRSVCRDFLTSRGMPRGCSTTPCPRSLPTNSLGGRVDHRCDVWSVHGGRSARPAGSRDRPWLLDH